MPACNVHLTISFINEIDAWSHNKTCMFDKRALFPCVNDRPALAWHNTAQLFIVQEQSDFVSVLNCFNGTLFFATRCTLDRETNNICL